MSDSLLVNVIMSSRILLNTGEKGAGRASISSSESGSKSSSSYWFELTTGKPASSPWCMHVATMSQGYFSDNHLIHSTVNVWRSLVQRSSLPRESLWRCCGGGGNAAAATWAKGFRAVRQLTTARRNTCSIARVTKFKTTRMKKTSSRIEQHTVQISLML